MARRPRPGRSGSVLLRGPNLFREYWRNPEATRAAFAAGWFDTGDLGSLDAAGFLTLVGRKHDLIITNGFNVYPQVVERVINACPGVRESAVLGVPDDRRGERVVAVVVRDDPRSTSAGCGPTAASAWSITSDRRRSSSWTSCRATPWARCSAASCGQLAAGDSGAGIESGDSCPSLGDVHDRAVSEGPGVDLAWISLAALRGHRLPAARRRSTRASSPSSSPG